MNRLAFLSVAILLASCGSGSGTSIVGKWTVDPAFLKANQASLPEGDLSTFHYEFKPDNTFKGMVTEGTYSVNGSTVTLTATKFNGQDITSLTMGKTPPSMQGDLSADGRTITLHVPTSDKLGKLPPAEQSGVPMVREGSY